MPSGNKREMYASLALFQRVLFHKIRTPLSIVSNELEYLGSLVDPAELALAKKKCCELSELLKNISQAFNPDGELCPLAELGTEDFIMAEISENFLVPKKVFQEILLRLALLAKQVKTSVPLHVGHIAEVVIIKNFFSYTGTRMPLCSFIAERYPQLDSLEPSIVAALAELGGYQAEVSESGDVLLVLI